MESWWPPSAWLSSGAAMFLFFNVLVGAIAILSRGQQGGRGGRLCRSASSMVLDRLRSFTSMFAVDPAAEWHYHTSLEAEELQVGETTPEPAMQEPAASEPPSVPAVPLAVDAAASMPETTQKEEASAEKSTGLDDASVQGEKHHTSDESSSPPVNAALDATAEAEKRPGKREQAATVAAEATVRRERSCGRDPDEAEGKAEFNERAEQFIRQFREDLKLQRLNSIINYTRTLRRRAGAALAKD